MRLPCEWLEYSVGREIQTYSLTCPKAMNKLKPTHKKKSHARIRYARGVRGDRVGAAAAGARGARTRHKGLIVGVHRSIGGFRVRVGRERERQSVWFSNRFLGCYSLLAKPCTLLRAERGDDS